MTSAVGIFLIITGFRFAFIPESGNATFGDLVIGLSFMALGFLIMTANFSGPMGGRAFSP